MTPLFLYRYRSITSLLGEHEELEKQEIYLAAPDEMNDPMEGYKDVFWLGDSVLWRNFFRHYLRCLAETTIELLLSDDASVGEVKIPVRTREADFPTESYRQTIRKATAAFLAHPTVANLLAHLAKLGVPLRREAVLFYLSRVHHIALRIVLTEFAARGFMPTAADEVAAESDDARTAAILKQLEDLCSSPGGVASEEFETVFEMLTLNTEQIHLGLLHQNRAAPISAKRMFLGVQFVPQYLTEVVASLIHPRWFTACFSSNCTNASMWGTYAKAHTGAVLKFDAGSPDKPLMKLEGAFGAASSPGQGLSVIRSTLSFSMHKVEYADRAPEIDFFKFLGQLPKPEIENAWAVDDTGATSERIRDTYSNLVEWRRELWDFVRRSATTKLSDWSHEVEYRLFHVDSVGLIERHRALKYDFASLKGIVFGIGTAIADKLKIVEIIDRKCRATSRSDFEFLQARYNRRTGKIDVVPSLIDPRLGPPGQAVQQEGDSAQPTATGD
jgi:hypothetical protein